MEAFDQALAALRSERDQLTGRLGLVERAIEVFEQLGGVIVQAPETLPTATPSRPKSPKVPGAPNGQGKAVWTCKACGQRGHSARSPECPRRAKEPKPAPAAAKDAKKPVAVVPPTFHGDAKGEAKAAKDRLSAIKSRASMLLG